jgi:cyclic pyranopterin phosphate synthase
MVNVGDKLSSRRMAKAQAVVYVGPVITKLIQQNEMKKGDVLSISQIAGIIAAKRTADLLPLAHNIELSSIKVDATLNSHRNEVNIHSKIKCEGKTGVEMEALTSVAVAALCVYDMCKAITHDIVIRDIHLIEKTGGKSNYHVNRKHDEEQEVFVLKYKTDPIICTEIFAPIHI